MSSILIIDDEPNIRRMVGALLRTEGYDVREAATGREGVASIQDDEPDIALLDLMMPGELDGLATLSQIRDRHPDLPIIMMSGRASLADAVRATKLGAVNFLEKPLSPESVLLALSAALELRQTRRTARALREELGLTGDMVGSSSAMARVREIIQRVASSDSRILIGGESGTGKELVAAAIHDRSPRRYRPLVRVNCAAIPRDLLESEMFGHEKGAFTGATTTRAGRFELAHTGTLFLDEVGDLTIEAQAKLLRAIEAKEIQRVGGNRTIHVDVRIIAATNKDLASAVADGTFREDLYFRLNVIPITLPPLRGRTEDIEQLIAHFSTLQHQRTGRPSLHWSDEALHLMRNYTWPGNVRELANLVERIAILNDGSLVRGSDVRGVLPIRQESARMNASMSTGIHSGDMHPKPEDVGLTDLLDTTERQLITEALARADGNIAEAARQLRTDRPNLYRRMKRLGITGAGILALIFTALPTKSLSAQVRDSLVSDTGVVRSNPSTHDQRHLVSGDSVYPTPADKATIHAKITVTSGKVYNRVEGLPIITGPTLVIESGPLSIDAAAYGILRTAPGIRFREPESGHDTHIMARFGPDHIFGIGLDAYAVAAPVERWQITEPEAGLAAFLLHRDYLDYYGRHGGKISAIWKVNEKASMSLGYASERWTSLVLRNPFSLFRNGDAWRDNPQMDEGRFHIFTADAVFDTRNDERDPAGGWYLTGSYELGRSPRVLLAPRTPGNTQSSPAFMDVRYGRVFFDVRRYNRISPRTELNGRVVFGGWVQGDELPLQRKLSLGGPGTLPGYNFRAPAGTADVETCAVNGQWTSPAPAMCDRVMLGQLEFRTDLAGGSLNSGGKGWRGLQLAGIGLAQELVGVVFLDVGRGWRTTQPWPTSYKTDLGTGVDFGLLGIYVAKALTDWSQPANILLRVRRRF